MEPISLQNFERTSAPLVMKDSKRGTYYLQARYYSKRSHNGAGIKKKSKHFSDEESAIAASMDFRIDLEIAPCSNRDPPRK